jgi:hypothetical protein
LVLAGVGLLAVVGIAGAVLGGAFSTPEARPVETASGSGSPSQAGSATVPDTNGEQPGDPAPPPALQEAISPFADKAAFERVAGWNRSADANWGGDFDSPGLLGHSGVFWFPLPEPPWTMEATLAPYDLGDATATERARWDRAGVGLRYTDGSMLMLNITDLAGAWYRSVELMDESGADSKMHIASAAVSDGPWQITMTVQGEGIEVSLGGEHMTPLVIPGKTVAGVALFVENGSALVPDLQIKPIEP